MAEDSRFAVFDFEEDLFLDPVDIFDAKVIGLPKAQDSCNSDLVPPASPCQDAVATKSMSEFDKESLVLSPVTHIDAPVPSPTNEGAAALSPSDPSLLVSDKLQQCAAVLSASDPSLLISDKLQQCVQTMTSKVEQLQREVLQATRARSILKKAKLQRNSLFKDREAGNFVSKRPRLFDAARTEAVKRKKNADILRLCGTILKHLTLHKWAWPFVQPVDVEALQLHDYYKIIRRPMDLGTIRSRLEAKDGTGYRNAREFCEDVRLVFRNAMLYNESWNEVHVMAKTLLHKFEDRWKVSIEPRLAEEEERVREDQPDSYLSDIADLHAEEERAARQLCANVISQLTDVESKVDSFLVQILAKCRNMGNEEKKALFLKVQNLPSGSLSRLVEIVTKNNVDAATDDISVDLEALDTGTLWRLHFHAKMVTDSAEEDDAEKPPDSESKRSGPSEAHQSS